MIDILRMRMYLRIVLVSVRKRSCQYSQMTESNGFLQLFMLDGPFYIVKVPIVTRRQEEEGKTKRYIGTLPFGSKKILFWNILQEWQSRTKKRKLCSKNYKSSIVDCSCLQNIISCYVHATSRGLKEKQVPPSKETNEHWSNPNVLEQRYGSWIMYKMWSQNILGIIWNKPTLH